MIRVECDGCGKSYRLKPELAGKRARCKACGEVITVPKPRRAARKGAKKTGPPASTSGRRAAKRRRPPEDDFDDFDDFDNYDEFGFDDYGDEDDFGTAAPPMPPLRRRPSGSKTKKRKRKKRKSGNDNTTLLLILGLVGGSIVLLVAVLGFFVPAIAGLVGGGIMAIGVLATMVGGLWCLVIAFNEDAICGILWLFVPFYSLYYVITRFGETQRGVFIWAGGMVLVLFGAMYLTLTGAQM